MTKIDYIEATIAFEGGETVKALIRSDGGVTRWGARYRELGDAVGVTEGIRDAVLEYNLDEDDATDPDLVPIAIDSEGVFRVEGEDG